MSSEYAISVAGMTKDLFVEVASVIQREEPSAQSTADGGSLWIPSSAPNWVDFSLDLTSRGMNVVSNLNRQREARLLGLIKIAIQNRGAHVDIEEV